MSTRRTILLTALLVWGCEPEVPAPEGIECTGALTFEPMPTVSEPEDWKLTVADEDWSALVADPHADLFVPCVLEVMGTVYDEGCRVRIRGGSSRDYPKKSLRITFDKGVPHPSYARKINLRAEYNDTSYLRSLLGQMAFRRFSDLPVSRVEPVFLEVNGEPYGLMMNIERVGNKMMKHHNLQVDELFEADPTLILHGQGGGSMIPLPDQQAYTEAYPKSIGSPFLYDILEELMTELVEDFDYGTRYRASVDVVSVINYLTVMALIQNQDHVRKNYYIAPQPNGWRIFPWDLDLTFGCLYDDENGNTICDDFQTEAPIVPGVMPIGVQPEFPLDGHFNVLIHNVITDPELAPGFECRICGILEGDLWRRDFEDAALSIATMLEPWVAQDPKDRIEEMSDFWEEVDRIRAYIQMRADYISSKVGCSSR